MLLRLDTDDLLNEDVTRLMLAAAAPSRGEAWAGWVGGEVDEGADLFMLYKVRGRGLRLPLRGGRCEPRGRTESLGGQRTRERQAQHLNSIWPIEAERQTDEGQAKG